MPLQGCGACGILYKNASGRPERAEAEYGAERMNYVYLLKCADNTLYCGWTTDLSRREAAHNAGTGAKYTRSRRPVMLVYFEELPDRREALSRERQIKKMSREKKLELIAKAASQSEEKEQEAVQADNP